jgi:hypothetical protein
MENSRSSSAASLPRPPKSRASTLGKLRTTGPAASSMQRCLGATAIAVRWPRDCYHLVHMSMRAQDPVPRKGLWLVVASAAIWLILDVSAAQACGSSGCEIAPVPADGARIPGNTPALMVTSLTTAVSLIDALGNSVPIEVEGPMLGYRLVRPATPLTAGMFTLTGQRPDCGGSDAVSRFEVTPAAPTLRSAGVVVPGEPERRTVTRFDTFRCIDITLPAMVRKLDIRLTAEVEAFLPVAQLSLFIDGKLWRATMPGGGHHPVSEIWTDCGGTPEATTDGLSPGRHTGELRVLIPGATEQPAPATFEFHLDCAVSGPVVAPQAPDQRAGCNMAGGQLADSFAAALLIALAFLAIRSRSGGAGRARPGVGARQKR